MSIRYQPPSHKSSENKVYQNSPLPLEFLLAHRIRFYKDSNKQNTLVLTAQNGSEVSEVLRTLLLIKKHNSRSLSLPSVPLTFIQQGYFTETTGSNKETLFSLSPVFLDKIKKEKNKLRFELILPHVAILIEEDGAACVNSKPGEVDQEITRGQPNISTFWLGFYNKSQDQKEQQELVKNNLYLYKDLDQQKETDHYSGMDWVLSNLNLLNQDFRNKAPFETASKTLRSDWIPRLNGQPDPRHKGQVPFNLEYFDELEDNSNHLNLREALVKIKKDHSFFHQEASREKNKAEETGCFYRIQQDASNHWIEVFLSPPPDYRADETDFNKFSTFRESSNLTNHFEMKENHCIVKSTGGVSTYRERFRRIAEDLRVSINGDLKSLPIVLSSIEPPTEEDTCLDAFREVYGPNRKIIIKNRREEENDDLERHCVRASPA